MKTMIALATCAALATGCFKVTYQNPALMPNGMTVDGRSSFFILGLVGDEVIPAYQMCPGGVARIQTGASFVDLLLTVVTIGIYTPRSYEIDCGGMR